MNHGKKKLLKEALLEAQLQEFSLFPSEEELDQTIVFSHRLQTYIRNLASLADKKERKFIYLGFHPVRKAVAVFIILLLLSAPITVPAITKGIIQIIQLIKGDYVEIHHAIPDELLETIPEEIVYYGEPTWLPQEYQLQDRIITVNSCYSQFTSPDDYPIHLNQYLLTDKGPSLDNEDTTLTEVVIQNNYPGLCTSKDGYATLTWSDGYYQYQLIGPIDLENIVRIANSIIPITK
jgi:hypothetical protein